MSENDVNLPINMQAVYWAVEALVSLRVIPQYCIAHPYCA